MNTDVVKIAEERIEKLKADRSDIDQEIDELERFLSTYQKLTGRPAVLQEHRPPPPVANASAHDETPDAYEPIRRAYRMSQAKGKSKTQSTLDAIEVVLSLAKQALTPREIYDELSAAGVEVAGKIPAHNVSAMLSNSRPRFEKAATGQGWTVPMRSSFWPKKETESEVKSGAFQ